MSVPHLELNFLGGFEIRVGEERISLASKKGRALLALLAMGRGQPLSRDKLAALLWCDSGDEHARMSLRQTLTLLRKSLGPGGDRWIESTADGVSLSLYDTSVDALRFEKLSGQPGKLQLAAELYRGPFLDGLEVREDPFDEWLLAERRRLCELGLLTLEQLLAERRSAGDTAGSIDLCYRILRLDPLREQAHVSLMELFLGEQRFSDAMQQYQKLKSALEAELGVEPSPPAQALYESILQRRDARAAPTKPTVRASAAARLRADGRPSVAVLPFENLCTQHQEDYLSDGITEDIITELSRFPNLFVVARNSSFGFKEKRASIEEIRRELGVDYVVEGSVRRSQGRVRVSAQLNEAESGRQIWAERYDRELVDVFDLQDELTRAIVAVLAGRVESFETQRVVRKAPKSMLAYELLLAGKVHHHRVTKADNEKALELLDRALSLDPNYAAAWAWKGCVLGQALARGFRPDKNALFQSAEQVVNQALKLDDNEVECHRILAEICMIRRKFEQAEYHNERALSLNCNDPRLAAQKGELLTWCGDADSGCAWLQSAMELDPYSSSQWAHLLGRALLVRSEYEAAISAYRKTSYPRFATHADLAGCYAKLENAAEARDQASQTLKLNPNFSVDAYVDQLLYQHEPYRKHHRQLLKSAPFDDWAA